ncbi:MAG: hypothetical protein IPG58_02780 [Acidobacteria bacterium]|nr:hypothetical protein [Acidobacteriota bacterium]
MRIGPRRDADRFARSRLPDGIRDCRTSRRNAVPRVRSGCRNNKAGYGIRAEVIRENSRNGQRCLPDGVGIGSATTFTVAPPPNQLATDSTNPKRTPAAPAEVAVIAMPVIAVRMTSARTDE